MINVASVENMKKSDLYTTENLVPATELMARAAREIFDAVNEDGGWRAPVAVVCGIGNNAGDGFAVAELLADAGIDCTIFLLSEKFTDSGKYYFDRCAEKGVKVSRELELSGYGTVLDCIFGMGFHGEVGEPFRSAIEKINASGAYVVSADINSGLGGDSGLPGGICVRSDLTIAIGSFKSGHFLNSAKDVMKKKVSRDIGIKLLDKPAKLIEPSDIGHLFVRDRNDSNKGDYGYVALIGGSVEYSGAAKLANLSLSALRSGAGVAKLAVPGCIANAVTPYLLESTLFRLDSTDDGCYCFSRNTTERLLSHTKAAAIGMGMGRSVEVKRLLQYLLCEYSGRLIVDADGLNMLSELSLPSFKNSSCRLILTPHLKEFERLSGKSIDEVRADPVSAAKDYARASGAIVLLKGPTTVITDGETVYLVDRGCPGMATAGSGDVLSGILSGICGFAPDEELLLGVAAGAYLNGLAGELAEAEIPAVSMLSGDTIAHIPAAVKRLVEAI